MNDHRRIVTHTLYDDEEATLLEVLEAHAPIVAHSDDPVHRDAFARLVKRIKAEGKPPKKKDPLVQEPA